MVVVAAIVWRIHSFSHSCSLDGLAKKNALIRNGPISPIQDTNDIDVGAFPYSPGDFA
jgi:hypothetical protein